MVWVKELNQSSELRQASRSHQLFASPLLTSCSCLRQASSTSRSAKASAVPWTRSDCRFIHLGAEWLWEPV